MLGDLGAGERSNMAIAEEPSQLTLGPAGVQDPEDQAYGSLEQPPDSSPPEGCTHVEWRYAVLAVVMAITLMGLAAVAVYAEILTTDFLEGHPDFPLSLARHRSSELPHP